MTAKIGLGLDHNETHSRHGWHRDASFVMLAFGGAVLELQPEDLTRASHRHFLGPAVGQHQPLRGGRHHLGISGRHQIEMTGRLAPDDAS